MSGNHWFPHYPGDYARKTAHLTMMEDGAYRRLLDHYYSTGAPLPEDKERLYRVCRAFTSPEQGAVDAILSQFFELAMGAYHNARADSELIRRAEKRSKLAASGRRGAQKRWREASGSDGQAIGLPNGDAMASPHPQPQNSKDKSRLQNTQAPNKAFRSEGDQRQIVEARDERRAREAHANAEAAVGRGPELEQPLSPEKIEFLNLRRDGEIPREIEWNNWKLLSATQRSDLICKPGPRRVPAQTALREASSSQP
jgi:uncharacterized protein YdaU (DUF1376 family)